MLRPPPSLDRVKPLRSRDVRGLRTDGPTRAEWVKAGYKLEHYPPSGYAPKP